MPPAMVNREPGNAEVIVSLGGVKSTHGRGRIVSVDTANVGLATGATLLWPNNPLRLSALVQNISDGATVLLYIGSPFLTGTPQTLYLFPHGSFQIDQDFPWTGPVYATTGGLAADIQFAEISIDGG